MRVWRSWGRILALVLATGLAGCGSLTSLEPAPSTPSASAAAPTAAPPPPTATPTPLPATEGRIAFSKGHNIWVYSGGAAKQLTTIGAVQNPSWSPDGSQLAFDRAGKNNADLYVMD